MLIFVCHGPGEQITATSVTAIPENHEPAAKMLAAIMESLGFEGFEVKAKSGQELHEDALLSQPILDDNIH